MDDITIEYENTTASDEVMAINLELNSIECQLNELRERKNELNQRKRKINENIAREKSIKISKRNWESEKFEWSKKVKSTLTDVFKIPSFREHQLPTINAVLSGQDTILIMPTGGGKSICYQLPALILKGITVVISPLIALMEDQINGLRKVKIRAGMLNTKTSSNKEEQKAVWDALDGKNCNINLIYITPEYMKKSKRFMSKLQKAFNAKTLKLFAIDEVHCCSTWGHDFRPDYQFLGCLKTMFPSVPILGLTATATSTIINDVQEMLDLQGCLVLRAPFNRPNLFYEVRQKPSDKEKCLEMLGNMLKTRFSGKSGIIYTTTIKDSEQLATELKKLGLKVGCYHAMLESDVRTKIYNKWISGEYQAVVATIAFGLGIDKPDVRFVIHHCMSKSMENYYQESGRAGRDGKKAACIVLYRLGDIFKLSTMVIGDKVGLRNLYKSLEYCLSADTCRRSIIATHFDETWVKEDCAKMCDHCARPGTTTQTNLAPYCQQICRIIDKARGQEKNLTLIQLLDAWYQKGASLYRVSSVPVPSFSRETAEIIIAFLLIDGYLKEEFAFNVYANLTYLIRGPKAVLVTENGRHEIIFTHSDMIKFQR